ncbi:MAG: ATPase [Maioricimonas sp. JB049]
MSPDERPLQAAARTGTATAPGPSVPHFAPRTPATLEQAGIGEHEVAALLLKTLYLQGPLTGFDLADQLRLPFSIVDLPLQTLQRERCLEVASARVVGRVSYRFQLTEFGRIRAREAFEQSRYVGPAPVSLEAYLTQCRLQSVARVPCDLASLIPAFDGVQLPAGFLELLGPAICSGRALLLHGSPGNGKTLIGHRIGRFLTERGGDIFVPYAVSNGGSIVTIFDPTVHDTTDGIDAPSDRPEEQNAGASERYGFTREPAFDRRWRQIRRPVVVTCGELTGDMLELRHGGEGEFYQAPPHVKANGGLFFIDDLGRQQIPPKVLLNRWILPLEQRIDYLTLSNGRRFAVPFEQFTVFSTNLNAEEWADDAFLRRIPHTIHVGPPTTAQLTAMFRRCCEEAGLSASTQLAERLFRRPHDRYRSPRASDPQDFVEYILSICRFRGETPHLDDTLVSEAADRFFVPVTARDPKSPEADRA